MEIRYTERCRGSGRGVKIRPQWDGNKSIGEYEYEGNYVKIRPQWDGNMVSAENITLIDVKIRPQWDGNFVGALYVVLLQSTLK